MTKREDLKSGILLVGLESSVVATVAAVVPIGEGSVQVFYGKFRGGVHKGDTSERRLSAQLWRIDKYVR